MPREKILIAEDEPDIRHICVRILSSDGYQAVAVEDGLQAIEAARQERFDLLLSDIKMPKLDGLQTAQAVKELWPDIVCVVMTGFGTMDTAIQALQLGIDEFLVKPFTPDMLLSAVDKAIERANLRRENVRLRALVPLFELNKTFMSTVAEAELHRRLLDVALLATHADRAALLLPGEKGAGLAAFIEHDLDLQTLSGADGLLEMARLDRQTIWRKSGHQAPKAPWAAGFAQAGLGVVIVTPLMSKARQMGALVVARNTPQESFAPGDDEMLSILCGQAAIALENARLFQEIERAYAELKELDRLKSEFINIAAHELRTPLAILMGHASLLQEELQGPAGDQMRTIVRNALRLRELIDAMLNLRHLESGAARLHLERVDLRELVTSFTTNLESLAESKKQTLRAHIEDGLPPVMIDCQRLFLVFSNLISNAHKFTPEGGHITVRGWMEGNEVLVSVQDDGIGIPPGETDRIFERFYQVEDSLTRSHDGIGLGLAIVKGMVELWNGRIWVKSRLGEGSIFTFTIPQLELI